MNSIQSIIASENAKLKQDNLSLSDEIGIRFNLISLKNREGISSENYKDIKFFITNYIEYIKMANYGYDNLNYTKIDDLLNFLNTKEQIMILQYAISYMAKELPEYDRDWFIDKKRQSEIKDIFESKKFSLYLKAIFLYLGLNTQRLLLTLLFFLILTFIVLLPSPFSSLAIFEVSYSAYEDNFILNHLINVLSLFVGLENDFKITPINGIGVLIEIVAKLFFIVLVVNFIYTKIADKITLK